MYNQHRIYRVFRLINYLKSKPPKNHSSLAQLLEVTERSVYRYLDLLEQLGFEIHKTPQGGLYIDREESEVGLTQQEKQHIARLVQNSNSKSPLNESILGKLNVQLNVNETADLIFRTHLASIVEKIADAIVQRRQIRIVRYFSANSQTVSDRIVEPVEFTDYFESISAFEVSTGQNKYFNIQRISDVEILPHPFSHSPHHRFYKPDIFGYQGRSLDAEIEMQLSLRATLFLKEEYPLSRAFIRPVEDGKRYHFKARVQSYLPPARFALGMPNDVVVLGDEGFLKELGVLKNKSL